MLCVTGFLYLIRPLFSKANSKYSQQITVSCLHIDISFYQCLQLQEACCIFFGDKSTRPTGFPHNPPPPPHNPEEGGLPPPQTCNRS